MKRKIVLATVGSLGDLHPFMALALALREHDLRVIVASAEEYRDKVERSGLEFRPVRPSFSQIENALGMDRAALVRAVVADNYFLFRHVVMPHLRASYEDMRAIIQEADLVLTSSLAFGARLAAEELAIPWIAVVLQPFMFLSAHDPPVIPGAEWLSAVLRGLKPSSAAWALRLLKGATGGLMAPIHAARRDIGLPPTLLHPLFEGQFSHLGAIGLYSPVLGGAQVDYPAPTSIVGFASFDSEDGTGISLNPKLDAFLNAGPPPLVFTLGSTLVNSPGAFFVASLEAAQRLGRRAVLLVGADALAEHIHRQAPGVYVDGYAPYSLLFPRAAAVVHQGGVGTLAQALRSGRPQLIVPFFADQLDNARRARLLGAARTLAPKCYEARSAARELDALLRDPSYQLRATAVRADLEREDGAREGARRVMAALGRLADTADPADVAETADALARRRIV